MKIRNGFVSNSSSSSFIVGFERIPSSQKELQEMMFPKEQGITEIDGLSIKIITARVWADINMSTPAKASKIDDTLGGFHECYVRADYSKVDIIDEKYKKMYGALAQLRDHKKWEEEHFAAQNKVWDEQSKALATSTRQWKKDNWKLLGFVGKIIFIFSYSDNDGEEILEHDYIFRNLPNIQISHH